MVKLLAKYRHLRYWLFGLTVWIFLMLKLYAIDRGLHLSNNYYNIIMVIVVIPYVSGMLISFIYSKCFEKKFVWTIKNHLKFWVFGAVILGVWLVIVFVFGPFLPGWWNNTYTIIFFATIPSYFSGLIVNFVIEKWMG